MSDDDPFANVPDPEDDLARAEQRLTIRVEKRTYDKPVTVIEGFDAGSVDVQEIASDLKSSVGAGGTVDDGTIEIQGDHVDRVADLLHERGFDVA